jgi:hypothetical protein
LSGQYVRLSAILIKRNCGKALISSVPAVAGKTGELFGKLSVRKKLTDE